MNKDAPKYADIVFSTHNLLFPFVFDNKEAFEDLYKSIIISGWEKINSKDFFTDKANFSQYVYYHEYIRKIFYEEAADKCKEPLSYHFYRKFKNGTYKFRTGEKIYELAIPENGISLRIFPFNVGILSFTLINDNKYNFKDVLSINEFARRLYPQFYISGKPQIIPDEVSIELSENVSLTPENFGAYINNKSFESLPLPDFISKQLLKPFKNVKTIIDDRMYVLSYLEYDRLSEDLKGIEDMISHTENPIEPALASWYSYCFIDSDKPSVNNKKMLRELLDKITYRRWVEGGTLFGITRYSFVCLRNPGKDCSYIKDYMDRHYKDMAELLLSMRAILLHFAKLSKDISDNLFHNPNDYTKEIEKLRKNYIKFINNYWFYEVTPQEQGIEMYQIGMNVMELEKMKEDLRKDIQELYDYSASERNKQENVLLNRIAVLGFILLPVSIVTGLMGMNFNSFTNCDRSVDVINKAHSFDLGIGALFIALLTFSYSVIGFLFLFKTTIKSKIFKAFLYVLAVLLLVAAIRTCFNYHHIFSFIIDSVRNILFP